MTPGKAGFKREAQEKRDFSHSFEMTVRGKSGEISLFASRPLRRSEVGKKKSACSVRNDGGSEEAESRTADKKAERAAHRSAPPVLFL